MAQNKKIFKSIGIYFGYPFRHLTTRTFVGQSPGRLYKDHDLNAVTWNNIRKFVELKVCAKLYMHFLIFRPHCERSAENELNMMQFGFGSDSVYR